jgi:hypothetical protein
MTKIRVFGAGRDDEIVERNAAALGDDLFVREIEPRHFRQKHFGIALVAKNASDR